VCASISTPPPSRDSVHGYTPRTLPRSFVYKTDKRNKISKAPRPTKRILPGSGLLNPKKSRCSTYDTQIDLPGWNQQVPPFSSAEQARYHIEEVRWMPVNRTPDGDKNYLGPRKRVPRQKKRAVAPRQILPSSYPELVLNAVAVTGDTAAIRERERV
jgi:hypothetical protein